jgi:hypothetical protein
MSVGWQPKTFVPTHGLFTEEEPNQEYTKQETKFSELATATL